MYTVDLYAKIRRAVMVDGQSEREVARLYGLHRATVHKMLQFSLPPGYRRTAPRVAPKLGPYTGVIDALLEADRQMPKKQRHTARRIWQRLKDEHGFTGCYATVWKYVARQQLHQREVFVPLVHPPGHAQVDFGQADAVIAGEKQRIHFFCLVLPHSDAIFVKAYPAETTEAFLDGHAAAFAFFGGVPQSILYDNTKLAVAKILGDGSRQRTQAFSALQSHYLFAERFGRPGKGNDKGKVEGLVGFARRNFLVPRPHVASFTQLNATLQDACRQRQHAVLRGHDTESIAQRLGRDQAALLPLPAGTFEPCETMATRVSSLSLVRYHTNDYSVPTQYGHWDVIVRGYVDRVEISCRGECIAVHPRSYAREDCLYNPLHYLPLLERKPNALDQAAPLTAWHLPPAFEQLRRLLEARLGKRGRKEYIQGLRLLETFGEGVVVQGVEKALALGALSFDAVKHLVLGHLEQRPPKLDLTTHPYLPQARVATTDPKAYLVLLDSAPAVSRETEVVQ
jgi:transposase